jgi:alpha-tubulin suppressor-like RCC1 family protein
MGDGIFYEWMSEGTAAQVPDVYWSTISYGDNNCGITPGANGGALYCWANATPSSPFRMGSDADWLAVEGGIDNMCGIRSGGNLYCWGDNDNGQIGDGSEDASSSPSGVALQGNWTAVSTGDYNATCGIRSGELYCWGRNSAGMLGLGTTDSNVRHSSPQRVGSFSDWESVSVGEAHVCAIRSGGQLFCWGQGGANGAETQSGAPARVGSFSDWVGVAAGVAHNIAVRENGTLYYWGSGLFGAYDQDSVTPIVVDDSRDYVLPLYADYDLSCATSGGVPFCFGTGPLGQGGNVESAVPLRVMFQ